MSPDPTRADDERLLSMLDARDFEGMTSPKIAERFSTTRSAVCGHFARIKNAEKAVEKEAIKNNQPFLTGDGTMKRKWWCS